MDLVGELEDKDGFSLFTKLMKRRINGAILSIKNLNEKEIKVIDKVSFIEKKLIFDCPYCGNTRLSNQGQVIFNCDCGKVVNIANVDTEERFYLTSEYFNYFKKELIDTKDIDDKRITILFGEKDINIVNHNNTIYLHFTPFQEQDVFGYFLCLDDVYLDHFLINWNSLDKYLLNRNKIVSDLISWRKENIEKQINWSKIDDTKFQELCYETIAKEKLFDKLESGGKGADQGKDMFGYAYTKSPIGRPEEVKTLIQCKFTLGDASFNSHDINEYVIKAKRHNCNYMLFITNGNISGDAETEIHSNAYRSETFRDVNTWNNHKLLILLEKYPHIRLKYFYSREL